MATARLQLLVHRKILFRSILTLFLTQCTIVGARRFHPNRESCMKTDINLSTAGGSNPFGLAITYRCMQIKGAMFSFRTGEYSMKTGAIRCDNKPVYRYRTNIRTTRSIRGAVTECEPGVSDACVSVFAENSTVSISTLYSVDSELDKNREEEFFPTEVLFDIKSQLKRIARNALTAYLDETTDELDIRRRIFLGDKKINCNRCRTRMCQRTEAQCFYY